MRVRRHRVRAARVGTDSLLHPGEANTVARSGEHTNWVMSGEEALTSEEEVPATADAPNEEGEMAPSTVVASEPPSSPQGKGETPISYFQPGRIAALKENAALCTAYRMRQSPHGATWLQMRRDTILEVLCSHHIPMPSGTSCTDRSDSYIQFMTESNIISTISCSAC